MEKSKFIMTGVLVIVLIFGMTFVGCTTTHHNVEISNVQNIKEVTIRNAGTTNWGANLAENLKDIDKSKYSETVDIRVIDSNGVVYSKYNVPFGDSDFVQTNQTRTVNQVTLAVLGTIVLIIVGAVGGGQ